MKFIFIVIISTMFSGCKITTSITSDPVAAKVFIDNVYVGKTPYLHTVSRFNTSLSTIKLIVVESKLKNISTIEKLEMFEKLSKKGKIPKKKLDKLRPQLEKKNDKPLFYEKIPKALKE
jgi:hypothetical protein